MALPADLPLPRFVEKASYHWMTWGHYADPGHTLEMVMDPEYWVHALQANPGIKQYDKIEVIARDGSYGVLLMIVALDERRQWAETKLLQQYWGAGDVEVAADVLVPRKDNDGWVVEWAGSVHRWRVVSPAGAVADKGFSTREDAEARLREIKPPRAA